MVEVVNIHKSFDDNVVLDGVSFSVEEGDGRLRTQRNG